MTQELKRQNSAAVSVAISLLMLTSAIAMGQRAGADSLSAAPSSAAVSKTTDATDTQASSTNHGEAEPQAQSTSSAAPGAVQHGDVSTGAQAGLPASSQKAASPQTAMERGGQSGETSVKRNPHNRPLAAINMCVGRVRDTGAAGFDNRAASSESFDDSMDLFGGMGGGGISGGGFSSGGFSSSGSFVHSGFGARGYSNNSSSYQSSGVNGAAGSSVNSDYSSSGIGGFGGAGFGGNVGGFGGGVGGIVVPGTNSVGH